MIKEYNAHKNRAKRYGIPFELEYWEWLQIWQDSGHMHERGKRKGEWCMARTGDTGPYAIGNVRIARCESNHAEAATVRRRNTGTGKAVSSLPGIPSRARARYKATAHQ
jgi:hypothetical protein